MPEPTMMILLWVRYELGADEEEENLCLSHGFVQRFALELAHLYTPVVPHTDETFGLERAQENEQSSLPVFVGAAVAYEEWIASLRH
jgi:hypothetical protein